MQLEEVALLGAVATGRAPDQAGVAGDAVVDVDDQVARLEPLEDVLGGRPTKSARPTDTDGPEKLTVGDHDGLIRAAGEAAVEAAIDQRRRRPAAAASRSTDTGAATMLASDRTRSGGPTGRR